VECDTARVDAVESAATTCLETFQAVADSVLKFIKAVAVAAAQVPAAQYM
jgi:hypothetical protein